MAEAYLNNKIQVTSVTTSSLTKNEATSSTRLKRPNVTQILAVPMSTTASNSSQSSILKAVEHSSTAQFSTSPTTYTATSSSMSNQPSGNPISNQETSVPQQAVGEVASKRRTKICKYVILC